MSSAAEKITNAYERLMCGLTVIWGYHGRPVRAMWIDEFTRALLHRGPDGLKTVNFEKPNLSLGHARLSILDVSVAGDQPMSFADGRYQIVYNGEIYNFLEVKNELEKVGYSFKTESDTEVILAAYHFWGEACQDKFNGMWAFVIFDLLNEIIFVSRDRFGVKPLFYYLTEDYFICASELKAFLALPRSIQPDVDPTVVAWMTNIEDDQQTILKNVSNLNAGYCLRLAKNGVVQRRKWWKTKDHLVTIPSIYEEQVEQYQSLFFDACQIRLRSDVPIATALSGGLDSSSIFSSLHKSRYNGLSRERITREWQSAFFLDFKGRNSIERKHAQIVCDDAGADLNILTLDPRQISPQELADCIFALEAIQNSEPGLGPWLLYKAMRESGIVVSIDGHGGDETVAGYSHYPLEAMKGLLWKPQSKGRWQSLEKIFKETSGVESVYSRRRLFKMLLSDVKRSGRETASSFPFLRGVYGLGSRLVRSNFQCHNRDDAFLQVQRARRESTVEHLSLSDRVGWGPLNTKLYQDFHSTTLPKILRNFDRLSMASGVESRAPFLDWRLVCYAFSLPEECKLGASASKQILRDSMRGIVPEATRTRKDKEGFASPLGEWLTDGFSELMLDHALGRRFLESEVWTGRQISQILESAIKNNNFREVQRLWKFVQAGILLDSFDSRKNTRWV